MWNAELTAAHIPHFAFLPLRDCRLRNRVSQSSTLDFIQIGETRFLLQSRASYVPHLTRYSASCTICPVVLDGELAVPSRFNRTAPETRYSRVEFLLQGRAT